MRYKDRVTEETVLDEETESDGDNNVMDYGIIEV